MAAVAGPAVFVASGQPVLGVLAALFAVPGGTAPDWLECSWWAFGNRSSLIPHRTVTHWVAMWVGVLAYAMLKLCQHENGFWLLVWPVVAGFSIGALSHCLCDAMTSMGVPVLNPFTRKSLYHRTMNMLFIPQWMRHALYGQTTNSMEKFAVGASFAVGMGAMCAVFLLR